MKKALLILFLFFACPGCNKREEPLPPGPKRELSVPEKVEKEMMDVLGKDWQSLADTMQYFNRNMLLKGKTRGRGPDRVFYELEVKRTENPLGFEAVFMVEDSTMAVISGRLKPTELTLEALNTVLDIKKEKKDSCSISASDVKLIVPVGFLLDKKHRAALLYKEERVGWLTRESFENTDYSTGTYIVIRYYGDNRSFALFDNGLSDLLGNNLKYVLF